MVIMTMAGFATSTVVAVAMQTTVKEAVLERRVSWDLNTCTLATEHVPTVGQGTTIAPPYRVS